MKEMKRILDVVECDQKLGERGDERHENSIHMLSQGDGLFTELNQQIRNQRDYY